MHHSNLTSLCLAQFKVVKVRHVVDTHHSTRCRLSIPAVLHHSQKRLGSVALEFLPTVGTNFF